MIGFVRGEIESLHGGEIETSEHVQACTLRVGAEGELTMRPAWTAGYLHLKADLSGLARAQQGDNFHGASYYVKPILPSLFKDKVGW